MLKKIIGVLGALLILIQFIRPDQTNPTINPQQDFQNVANPPSEVMPLLKVACYDCHSYETVYPWYSQIAPVSWWLGSHVKEGREHLNFSTFGQLPTQDQSELMGEIGEVIQEGKMPLSSYTWAHPKARFNPEQKNTLVNWLNQFGGAKEGGAEEKEED